MSRSWVCGFALGTSLAWAPACTDAVPGDDIVGPACEDGFRSTYFTPVLDYGRNVDILFVIDNSGSMIEEQIKLNAGAAALFEILDAAEVDYRIAFTTTDNGNPWCPPGSTTPEAGRLVLSPCTSRLDDFVFNNGAAQPVDFICLEQCTLSEAELAISPTTAGWNDEQQRPRPWMQRIAGRTNLPPDTDPLDAFRCFAPQGINGCGFESQLESMYLALQRTEDPDEDSYGFMRVNARLAVVILTDEVDCSYNRDYAEIFEQDGNRVFWSDPSAEFPSSAVCWNAGVSCSGDPSLYDSCEPTDKLVDGSDATGIATGVLHPVERYRGLLESLEQQKQDFDIDNELLLTIIAGVEGGGESWSVTYAEADDPEYQLGYGIGPGCTDANGDPAVPPVRMRALAEHFDPQGLWSVCADDYTAALADLGQRLVANFGPLCVTSCVADADLSTPQLEPACALDIDWPGGGDNEHMRECERGADGSYLIDPVTETYQLPSDVDFCYAALVDPDGSETVDPNDDISAECREHYFVLEYVIVNREGVALPDGTQLQLDCAYSDCPDRDCPLIGF